MIKLALAICLLAAVLTPLHADTAASAVPEKSRDAIGTAFGQMVANLWDRSDEFFHQGNYDRSIETLKIIAEIDPSDIEAYSVGAWLLASKHREPESLAFLKLGLSRNPDRYEMYEELGYHYFNELKDYGEAAKYYEKAVSFPNCPSVLWHALAHSYERSGQLKKSLEAWQKAAVLEPNDGAVKNNMKRVQDELAAQDSQKK